MFRLAFSNPLELGKVGAGRPYGYLYDYLRKQAELKRIDLQFISGMEIVQKLYGKQPMDPQSLGQAAIADLVASFEAFGGEAPTIFLGAGCASIAQMREIMFRFGNRTNLITTWFSSNYNFAKAVLEGEYKQWGIKADPPLDPFLCWRDLWEQRYSDCLIVPSQRCADTYEADEACKGKTRVVNFGVDSALFHPVEQKSHTDFRVLFAGGNWVRKGLFYLIQAWNELELPGVLTTIGTQDPGVAAHRTVYQGWVPDEVVPEYYRKNDVFCLPSLEEGQALAGLEAIASGLPVVCTKESGLPIEDGIDGLIVPSRDSGAIKEALKRLYDHPGECEAMGKKAREKALELTWEKFGEGVLTICEEFNPALRRG